MDLSNYIPQLGIFVIALLALIYAFYLCLKENKKLNNTVIHNSYIIDSLREELEKPKLDFETSIGRVEVIDEKGRLHHWNKHSTHKLIESLSIQDDGRTLKIFIKPKE